MVYRDGSITGKLTSVCVGWGGGGGGWAYKRNFMVFC